MSSLLIAAEAGDTYETPFTVRLFLQLHLDKSESFMCDGGYALVIQKMPDVDLWTAGTRRLSDAEGEGSLLNIMARGVNHYSDKPVFYKTTPDKAEDICKRGIVDPRYFVLDDCVDTSLSFCDKMTAEMSALFILKAAENMKKKSTNTFDEIVDLFQKDAFDKELEKMVSGYSSTQLQDSTKYDEHIEFLRKKGALKLINIQTKNALTEAGQFLFDKKYFLSIEFLVTKYHPSVFYP